MQNPAIVKIPVTQPNVPLYVMVDTFATYAQRVTIQMPDGTPYVAMGSGEGKRIGYIKYPVATPGIYTFIVHIQYNDGSGYKDSKAVSQGALQLETLNQTVIFSEDSTDGDKNDCFITFMWFSTGASAGGSEGGEAPCP